MQRRRDNNLQFKDRCVLDFDGIDFNSPVYRVFPVERLLQLFTDKKNTLVKPAMWDDPFENIMLQQKVSINGKEVNFDSITERYYGQCWTLNTKESDALWRIYSPNKMGVRVKTTLHKLWNSFYNLEHNLPMYTFFIGKIEYAPESKIKTYFENPDIYKPIIYNGNSERDLVGTFLIKREEFTHENEIRLIYSGNHCDNDLTKNIYQYSINPNDLIDELLFDPRFDTSLYAALDNELKERFKFTKPIQKSKLYQLPKFNIKIVII